MTNQFETNTDPIHNQPMPLVFKMNSNLLNQAKKNKAQSNMNIYFGPIATDQHFPFDHHNDVLLEKNHILAVDMEDNGVAQACWLYYTPLIIIRAISDNIINKIPYTQKTAKLAARNAANVAILTIKAFSK